MKKYRAGLRIQLYLLALFVLWLIPSRGVWQEGDLFSAWPVVIVLILASVILAFQTYTTISKKEIVNVSFFYHRRRFRTDSLYGVSTKPMYPKLGKIFGYKIVFKYTDDEGKKKSTRIIMTHYRKKTLCSMLRYVKLLKPNISFDERAIDMMRDCQTKSS